MNKIIEKLYAKELGLITDKPVTVQPKQSKLKQIWQNVWARQRTTIKLFLIALFFILVLGFVYYYNQFITELYEVRLQTAQIDAEIDRKNTLLPNLVKVVEEHMAFERRVFIHAVDVRNALAPFRDQSANAASKQMDSNTFNKFKSAISKFQAVSENYPVLQSSEAYYRLMMELGNTATRMATARNRYNTAANRYNASLSLLPECIFGYIFGFKPVKTFTADKPS